MKVNMDNRVSQSYGNPYKTASNEMFSKILNNKNSESDQDSQRFPQRGRKPREECKGRRELDCDTDGWMIRIPLLIIINCAKNFRI